MADFEIYWVGSSFYSNKNEALALAGKSSFGEIKNGKIIYSVYEVLFLIEKKQAHVIRLGKKAGFHEILKKADHDLYVVFKDLREKGHILKEGLKFGADFRVYEKGDNPGKEHAKYLLYAIESSKKLDLRDFAAKSRIATTTHKKLLLALIDSEEDINYYEVSWKSIL